ncbi:imelysin family protein [uncultured Winogradskyella sp.]|uniref:imelysin family protein n=1 Tax=uncultured Winogradskyella sp. TaxID=395353 RepID=UPI002618EDA6|nr:imelysin family protein [uncultured Winogradskyella sp.]
MKWSKLCLPLIGILIIALAWSCSDDSSDTDTNTDEFNRQAMLTNWADNIIVPSYTTFGIDVNALKAATDNFEAAPTEANFSTLRAAWQDAYISWQNVSMFNIGPAETVFFRSFINTYPTNTSSIDTNIETGNYNLQDINLNDAQGFPALDYLLFGLENTDNSILEKYTTDANSSAYITYLVDLVDRIKALTDSVILEWQTGYRDTFVNNDGSSSNSSTNSLVNDWMEYYERIFRNGKIGFPAGVFSGGNIEADKVEAFYKKDLSKTLCLEALDALQGFFNGDAINGLGNGESLEDYLNFLNTMKEGDDLSTLINTQFNASRDAITTLNDNFYQQIITDNNAMLNAFEILQANVVLLKSDMFSALSIAVEFNSGDGD